MKIAISDTRKITAIQKDFNTAFPYLKIEFFSKPHRVGAPSSKKIMKPASATIGQSRTRRTKGVLTITPEMTVAELEQKFNELYGLTVQVFRKSGKVWLETTVTDEWTLAEQNSEGEALSGNRRAPAAEAAE